MPPEPVTISVNGVEVPATPGQLVIDAAEQHGVYIPRFCYHPRMRPVGMCRMCIVDIDTGRGPSLQPACMIPVADGMKVDARSEGVAKAQDGVLEFLLINHPLDCPVCDKGGECPLQDQAYAYGPGESRFVEEKRHFAKPIPISDLVYLDRERCILCDRCTRFAKEVAGDPLIHFFDRGNETQINTFPDHPFSSYFAGNTVQICPVGALTAKPFRFRARPWDLQQVESTCTSCSVGCRIVIQSSRNQVLRYLGVDVDPVNWGWLCDKGRFGFEAWGHEARLGEPLVRKDDELVGASWAEAITAATVALRDALAGPRGAGSVAVLGGARLTNEAAYAWAKLAKGVLGTDNVDCQLGDGLPADAVLGLPRATIDQVCAPGGTVVVLAPDLKEELPVLFLRLRDAVIEKGARVFELAPVATSVTALATQSLRYRPGEAVEAMRQLMADKSLGKGPITCILGRPSLAEAGASIVDAAAALLEARPDTRFLPALRRANVLGALDMGLTPGFLPGRITLEEGRAWYGDSWSSVPSQRGLDGTGILEAAARGRIDTLVLLGADPLADFPDHQLAKRALDRVRNLIAVDTFLSDSSRRAHVVLPAAGYGEVSGSTTNIEGRVSLLERKVTPPGTAREDWIIAAELAVRLGADLQLESIDDVWAEVERLSPAHAGVTRPLLRSPSVRDGVVIPVEPGTLYVETPVALEGTRLPTTEQAEVAPEPALETPAKRRPQLVAFTPPEPSPPPRDTDSGLRLVATRKLYDRGTIVQHAPSLAGLAPGPKLRLHPDDAARIGLPDGARARVRSTQGSAIVEVACTEQVPQGVASLYVNQDGAGPAALIDAGATVTVVDVEPA